MDRGDDDFVRRCQESLRDGSVGVILWAGALALLAWVALAAWTHFAA